MVDMMADMTVESMVAQEGYSMVEQLDLLTAVKMVCWKVAESVY